MKNNKGITLIALIVTIIVLIILAGVAIAMLRGDNGILNRASEAKYENSIGAFDEQVRLAQMALRTEITANMVNAGDEGYIATTATNFGKLVTEVQNDLGVKNVNPSKVVTEGFGVYSYLNPGDDSTNGTGYILITYTDNALRSSLPADKVTATDGGESRINGIKFTTSLKSGETFSVNKAVLAYVIKVSNYNCELSPAIFTETKTVEESGAKGNNLTAGATAFAGTSGTTIGKLVSSTTFGLKINE